MKLNKLWHERAEKFSVELLVVIDHLYTLENSDFNGSTTIHFAKGRINLKHIDEHSVEDLQSLLLDNS